MAQTWRPLEDLPDDYQQYVNEEVRALAKVWNEQKQALEESGRTQPFLERLKRRWAIETGVIERTYTLDRGVTEALIEQGLESSFIPHSATNKDPQWVAAVIQDQQAAIQGIFDFVKGDRSLSIGYVKELHAMMMGHQDTCTARDSQGVLREIPLLRGEYKKRPNNPTRADKSVHEYSPPEQVASEMDRLIELHQNHDQEQVPPEVEAAWLHHRFTQIHPFQDGNGRVARALATLVLVKHGWFPLTITRDERGVYIRALEAADEDNLRPLTDLFAKTLKETFVMALTMAHEVKKDQEVDGLITAMREQFERERDQRVQEWPQAEDTALALQDRAAQRFERVRAKLEDEIGGFDRDASFQVHSEKPNGARAHSFRHLVVRAASELSYSANQKEYSGWVSLAIRLRGKGSILLSFHGLGQEYRGLIAASLSYSSGTRSDGKQKGHYAAIAATDAVFQINYRESLESTQARFDVWLESGLVKALGMWQKDH